MFKIENYNKQYFIRQPFEIYFCKDGKTKYMYNCTLETNFSHEIVNDQFLFTLTCKNSRIGNICDWLELTKDIHNNEIDIVYLTAFCRMVKTNEDKLLCLKIKEPFKMIVNEGLTNSTKYFGFNFKLYFKEIPEEVSEEMCPQFCCTNGENVIIEPNLEKHKKERQEHMQAMKEEMKKTLRTTKLP